MSEQRSVEQKAKDLRDGLRMVENKTIDGIPWYCAEAMAEEIARLRAENEQMKAFLDLSTALELAHRDRADKYASLAEAAEAKVLSLTKDLSEMRDRTDRLQLEANKTFNLECDVATLTGRVKSLEDPNKWPGLVSCCLTCGEPGDSRKPCVVCALTAKLASYEAELAVAKKIIYFYCDPDSMSDEHLTEYRALSRLAAPEKPSQAWSCVCDDPTNDSLDHRQDGPCVVPEKKPWECKTHKLIGGTSPSCPLCPPSPGKGE